MTRRKKQTQDHIEGSQLSKPSGELRTRQSLWLDVYSSYFIHNQWEEIQQGLQLKGNSAYARASYCSDWSISCYRPTSNLSRLVSFYFSFWSDGSPWLYSLITAVEKLSGKCSDVGVTFSKLHPSKVYFKIHDISGPRMTELIPSSKFTLSEKLFYEGGRRESCEFLQTPWFERQTQKN